MSLVNRSSLLLIILLYSCLNTSGQEAKVDEVFKRYAKPQSPGAAVAVVKGDEVIFKKGYGMANLEYDIPITPSTIFHIASVSKQFTVYSVLLLEQKGDLSLDDDVRKYIPEVPDFGHTITLRHLATHTSGMRDQWALLGMAGWRLDDVITKEQIMKLVSQQKELNFEPGEEYLYCNTGFTLLAEVVSRVSGRSFADFTDKYIFQPLEMKNTLFYDDHQKIVKNRAYSYSTNGIGYKKSVLSYANVGATSLFTTVEDLSLWAMFLNEPTESQKPLVDEMSTKALLNNGRTFGGGMGQFMGPYKGIPELAHGGADAGYRTYLARYPTKNMAVIVFSNLGEFQSSDMTHKVADIFLADAFPPETKPDPKNEAVEVDEETLKSYAGRYEIEPGRILTVSARNGQFYSRTTWEGRVNFIATSQTTFDAKNANGSVEFISNTNGEVIAVDITQNGDTKRANRVGSFDRKSVNREELVGSYYSEELQTTYVLKFDGKKLTGHHARHPDFRVSTLEKDVFSANAWFMRQIHFVRNNQGEITGMKVSNGRVRDLWFEKVN